MKKIILFTFLIYTNFAFAQLNQSVSPSNSSHDNGDKNLIFKNQASYPPQKIYLGLSAGINNPNGLIGLNAEYALPKFSFSVGLGEGTWGNKFGFEAKTYFDNYTTGWALGVNLTHSTGISNFKTQQHDEQGKVLQDITMNFSSQQTLGLMLYHYWKMGKKQNRFHLAFGYCAGLHAEQYSVVSPANVILSSFDKNVYHFISPGGITLSLGTDFGF